jgi:hypothetical protein
MTTFYVAELSPKLFRIQKQNDLKNLQSIT